MKVMSPQMLHAGVLLVALSFIQVGAEQCSGIQDYAMEFEMKWTAELDALFPAEASYGSVFAIARSSELTIVGINQNASSAVTSLANANDLRQLEEESKANVTGGVASDFFVDEEETHPPESTVKFELQLNGTRNATKVTAIAQLDPSPGWFVGGLELELCDEDTGKFKDTADLNLQGWDSGISPDAENYTTPLDLDAERGPVVNTPVLVIYGSLRAVRDGATRPDDGSNDDGGFSPRGLIIGIVVVGLLVAIAFLVWQVYRRMHKPAPVPLSGMEEQEGSINW